MKKIDVAKHVLVPKHTKLGEKEKKELYERYHITIAELPKISRKDPAVVHLDVKSGDVVKVIRKSQTSDEALFYRGVVDV